MVLTNMLRNSVSSTAVRKAFTRNMGISAVLCQKAPTDPIQKLFLEKLREYTQKSKAQGGGLVDASPEIKKQLADEMTKLEKQYGSGKAGEDMTAFPTFNFVDPPLDPINMERKE